MASLNSTITVTFELRPCVVGKEQIKGLFHHWENYSEVMGESLMIGGHSAGQVSMTFGLVEFENGEIKRCNPYDIRFLDDRFQDFCFDHRKVVK